MNVQLSTKPQLDNEPIQRQRSSERRLRHLGMRYFYWVPEGWSGHRVLVAVHGISRNWREQAQLFARYCTAAGSALIAPRFSQGGYRGYQRLEVGRRGISADRALLETLEDAAQLLGFDPSRPLRMFGFSGGAQFAHRFALAHPGAVDRLALAAAGFYSMPDESTAFPYGLAASPDGRGPFERRALALPMRVFVGDRDTARDAELRKRNDLDRQQGRDRVERARRFVLAVRASAASLGLEPNCTIELLPDCDHSFAECAIKGRLGLRVARFLFPDSARQLERVADPTGRPDGGAIEGAA